MASTLLDTLLQIPFYGVNASETLDVSLDGTIFRIKFDWSFRKVCWYVSFLDGLNNLICGAKRVSVGYPLLTYRVAENIPKGMVIAIDLEGGYHDPLRDDFGFNKRVRLYYAPSTI